MKNQSVKKLLAGLSALCVMGAALPTVSFAAETKVSKIVGDANGDGNVDLAEINRMTEECLGRRLALWRIVRDGSIDLQPKVLPDIIVEHLKTGMNLYDGGCG